MSRISLSIVYILIATIAVTATAQESEIASVRTLQRHTDQPVQLWETVVHGYHSEQFIVLTTTEPGVRHNCHVKSIAETELLCIGKFGQVTAYKADNVAALLNPGVHERIWPWFLGLLSLGGGVIAAACFVSALWGAIPLAILGTIMVLASPMVGIGAGNSDLPETVYYQRSGTSLSIKLH